MTAAGTIRPFSLSSSFLESYRGQQPAWGYSGLGYVVYKRTYARTKDDGSLEEFWETCQRVVEGTYNAQKKHCHALKLPWDDRKAQRSAQEMFKRMWDFKWLPPGRGLWMMGTPMVEKIGSGALNNCFSGDTEAVVFDDDLGLSTVPLRDLVGRDFLVPVGNSVAKATAKSFGEQELNRVTFKVPGRSKYVLEYDVTADHRWILADGSFTTSLKIGDRVTIKPREVHPSLLPPRLSSSYQRGFAHGLIFGDGTRHTYYPERHFIRLCGEKEQAHRKLLESLPEFLSTTMPQSYGGDSVVTLKLNKGENWKRIPDETKGVLYCRGFIDGWLAADGHTEPSGNKQLDSINLEGVEWLVKLAPTCGYTITGWSVENADTNFGPRSKPLNRVTLSTAPVDLVVQSIKAVGKQEVFCAVVPDVNTFVLAGGLETGNCGFVSTTGIAVDFADPFCWLMDMLMLGVGVGFDTKGAGLVKVQKPEEVDGTFVVDDSREGWVSLLRVTLNSYAGRGSIPKNIDYSKVRPFGSPIKGFGGVASGPEPLKELIESVKDVLNPLVGELITTSAIVDICNLVGRCVVAGNVRRSAEIAFGDPNDQDFLNLKNPDINKEALYHHRWASNNSIFATEGMDYSKVAELTAKNGEPGYEWLENARKYSRMGREPDFSDMRVAGANPCVTKDTWVHTTDGPRQVKDLIDTPFTALVNSVAFPSGKRGFWFTGRKEVFELKTDSGLSVKATANHKILVNRDNCEVWVPLEELQADDYVVLGKNVESPGWSGNGTFSSGYLVGHLLGDGTLKDNQAVFSVWDKDGPGIAGMMEEITKSIAHLSFAHRSDWSGWTAVQGRGEHRLRSKSVLALLQAYGMVAGSKRPDFDIIERQSSDFYRGFIRGLFDTDGSVQGSQTHGVSIRLSQVDLTVCKAVQRMLARLGIISKLYENRYEPQARQLPDGKGGTAEYQCAALHELIISNQSLQTFADVVGFSHLDKAHKLSVALSSYKRSLNRESFTSRVVSITSLGEEDVYDAEVSVVHRFEANGIIVHNCVEQSLEDRELCCLVETFPGRHSSFEDYKKTLKYAYLYAKTVTLVPTHDVRTNTVMMRNRRIGCSMSGIVQAIQKFGRRRFFNEFCDAGYNYIKELDQVYSDWLCVRPSIKVTSVKPSGSVSLLPGVTPGIHFPHAEYYVRRVRLQSNSPLVTKLYIAGYPVEDDKYSPNTKVVSFPVKETDFDRSKDDVTLWEQLELAAALQQYWADNQVSVTVTFKPAEARDIKYALELFETRLKGVSFLPLQDHGYEQAPYETITKEQYESMIKDITPLDSAFLQHESTSKFCDGDSCEV